MSRNLPLLALLFAASGFAGLVYEILWLRGLGLLFGNTVQAASTALAAFFLGLAGGGWIWGRRSATLARPLRTYALLEIAIAVSALPYLLLVPVYRALYEPIHSMAGESAGALLAVKFLAASAVLVPPAFFMGGTLPVMGQHVVRRAGELGRKASLLYAINTVGAAAGALCAGFYLPSALGFSASYGVAVALNLGVAGVAYRLDASAGLERAAAPGRGRAKQTSRRPLLALAFFSGFLTLGLEVLWTRMF